MVSEVTTPNGSYRTLCKKSFKLKDMKVVAHHRILKPKHPSELIKDLDENSSTVRLYDSKVKIVTIKLPACYPCHSWRLFRNNDLLNFKQFQTHNPSKIMMCYSERTAVLNILRDGFNS